MQLSSITTIPTYFEYVSELEQYKRVHPYSFAHFVWRIDLSFCEVEDEVDPSYIISAILNNSEVLVVGSLIQHWAYM